MAFKKTSDGRVFFQGDTGNAAAKSAPQQNIRKPAAAPRSGGAEPGSNVQQPTQMQILSLLRSLNDKLKATQLERNVMRAEMEEHRRSMEALSGKAQRGERAEKLAQETMRELEETRKLLLDMEERQAGIEKETKNSAEKINFSATGYRELIKRVEGTEKKQNEIGTQMEDALSQQAKLMRQVEKAIEDRTRFMRKIERIEETVIQTRDALNAKAMVLLTDGGSVHHAPTDIEAAMREVAEQLEPGIPTTVEEPKQHTFTRSAPLQAAAILLLVTGGILAGWAVSQMQRPQGQQAGQFQISDETTQEQSVPTVQNSVPADAAEKSDAIIKNWNVSDDTSAYSDSSETQSAATQAETVAPEQTIAKNDDVGTLDINDTEKLQKMLDENPDALAAKLNDIEPGSAGIEKAETVAAQAAEKPAAAQIASLTPSSLPVQETPAIDHDEPATAQAPAAAQPEEQPAPATPPVYKRSTADMHKLISPDSSLPDVVKKIEDQAFDNVPEAQHDLAAIYTAGHGGVEQNYKRALFWFTQSAEAGVPNAAYNLGVLYHQGLGTTADIKKAVQWYTKAADLGHPEAQYNLGIAYIEGVGVGYDPVKAEKYFKKAAAQGIMEASYNLGLIYENGLLGKPQPDEALVWYKAAADKGSPEAKAALEQLAKTLNIKNEDINRVVDSARKGKTGDVAPSAAPAPSVRSDAGRDGNAGMLAQVQEHLMGMGLYPGPADGTDSPVSQDAIRAYQALNKMDVTGRASNELLTKMLAE